MHHRLLRRARGLAYMVALATTAPGLSSTSPSRAEGVAPAAKSPQTATGTAVVSGREGNPAPGDHKSKPHPAAKASRKMAPRRPSPSRPALQRPSPPHPSSPVASPTTLASSQPAASQSDASAHVYTNDDLKKYIRPEDRASGAPGPEAAPPSGAASKGSSEQKAAEETEKHDAAVQADAAKAMIDAQARVKSAQDQVEQLKKQALSDVNPLVPPQAPLSEADRARRQGLPRDQLSQMTREQLKAAELELQAARSSLQALQASAPR